MNKPNTCCASVAQPNGSLTPISDDAHRRTVRDAYAQVAQASDKGQSSGSTSNCCCVSDDSAINTLISTRLGYSQADLDLAPSGADMGLGCGNPKAIAALKPGETVVDLGSGGGFDCFLAVGEVGRSGQVIGVDMTPEMVSKARTNALKGQYGNVEFRLGEIEHLPIADGTADVVISNCVINLSPDKPQVFREAFRVLKSGGRLAISDVVATAPLLARRGWLEGEDESVFLSENAARDDGLDAVRMSSITYRIATGKQAGRKVTTLQAFPGEVEEDAGKYGGFSLHAGVAAEANESRKLEKLCRYITRPAISEKRLSLTPQGRVRYQLKTPWRNGTTHVEFEPVEFIARLAALVPPPRAHLTRFHGIFAPNASLRAQLTSGGRGKGSKSDAAATADPDDRTPAEKHRAMSWSQRLKRVFGIDVETCEHCGGSVRIVASVEEPGAIRAILAHFDTKGALPQAHYLPAPRGPPVLAAP